MKLIKINEIAKRKSWDIEVENSHNFYANGILIHNSNAAIVKHKTKGSPLPEYYTFQSRENELAIGADNAAFMATMLTKSYKELFDGIDFEKSCVIYGEWAGKGIQKGVAISNLDRFFMVFAIKIDGVYHDLTNYRFIKNEDERIFNILDFPTYTIDIDFNNPLLVQNKLIELTMAVEAECPIGKQFFNNTMIDNIAYEENGKIWFLKENEFTEKFKLLLIDEFNELRKNNKLGINYIKFTM